MYSSRLITPLIFVITLLTLFPVTVSSQHDSQPEMNVVGGTEVTPGEYPWLVALIDAAITDEAFAFCGGALVDDGGDFTTTEWVLTAAHCLVDATPTQIEVLVGQIDLSQATVSQRKAVDELIIHPFYLDDNALMNDIALVRLATPVSDITPIKIATPDDAARFAPGVTAQIAGWGNRSPQIVSDFPSVAHKAEVSLVDLATCNQRYDDALSSMHLCAGAYPEGAVDSCQGDSGGPLMVPDGAGGLLHAGIVSFGVGCAWPYFPGVYARTAFFADWIQSQIDETAHVDIWQLPLTEDGIPSYISTSAPNTPFTYTLFVVNSGLIPLTDVQVTTTLPSGATLISDSISGGGTYSDSTRTITWSLAMLDPGELLELTYQVQAPSSVTSGNYQVQANSSDGPVFSTGRDPIKTWIDEPRFIIQAFSEPFVEVGTNYPVEFYIQNLGKGPNAGASALGLVVDLPPDLTATVIDDGGTQTGNQIRWTMTELPPETLVRTTVFFTAGEVGDITRISNIGLYNESTTIHYASSAVQVIVVPAVRYLPLISR
ncbi:trypsin-like serine protease [Chloroflexus aggregans]|uniref:Conserved repeat domain protein n=1 Tax=Chloroflexus aggregans (strain MD-66 / DSM 9485) TaxID=326427 RepID=B8GCU5_CHLAD|nr:trypsin-like serine protease [Chloroflexus aggregans]ACL23145.1 conserved repeat domain protein [Chloroflexus aggregans DSM 9485]